MEIQRTYVMVKPDGIQRRSLGEVIGRFERRGLKLVGAKLLKIPAVQAQRHYAEHKERPFFGDLVEYITSGPVLAMVWEGPGAITVARTAPRNRSPIASAQCRISA